MKNYLKDTNTNIRDSADVKIIIRDMMSVLLEGALNGELDKSLGYSKYDYKNKEIVSRRYSNSLC